MGLSLRILFFLLPPPTLPAPPWPAPRLPKFASPQLAGYLGLVPDETYYTAVMNGFIVFATLMLALSILMPSRLQGAAASEDDVY
jgi:hypothetical protein